jgi:PAS domain S-box-containing protein
MIAPKIGSAADARSGGVIFMDPDGRVTAFDPTCERMFGYKAAEIVGGELARLIVFRGDDTGVQVDLPRLACDPRHEWIGRRKSGKTFCLDLFIGPSGRGGDMSFVAIARDATERKLAEQALERHVEQLTLRDDAWSRLLRTAVHDLRGPLQIMSAFCGQLSKTSGGTLDERGRQYLSYSMDAVARMDRLLEDLARADPLSPAASGEKPGRAPHGQGTAADHALASPPATRAGTLVKPGAQSARLLLVEDNEGDVFLTREAFRSAGVTNPLAIARSGEEALSLLRGLGPRASRTRPNLILLDLNLPGLDGREVLREIRADADLKAIRVIVMSQSAAQIDILKQEGGLQADGYMAKPVNPDRLREIADAIEDFGLTLAMRPAAPVDGAAP